MVKKISHIVLLFCLSILLAHTAFAASFTASVDRKNVAVGESFTLELRLSGASPKGEPDFSPLEDDFTVYSTGRSSQTTIINNKMSSSINWQVTLLPKKEGRLSVPALILNSDAGKLKSEPIQINAGKPHDLTKSGQSRILSVDTEVSKRNPYKNEPVLLTVKLIARKSIGDVAMSDLRATDAIIEQQGDPEVYEGVLQGQRVKVIEARYLITPLHSGTLIIPGITFQGKVASGKRQDPFPGRFRDSFGMFEKFGGFSAYKPFAVSGKDITLDVKPPAAQMKPWLPAYKIELSDHFEGLENAKVGEPLTRKLTIVAEGLPGTGLPSLESQIDTDGHFKIYNDKPLTGDNLGKDGKSIDGWREESYTLIPQKAGSLTLPEIKLAWWNILDNKVAYATVPAKTIEVKGSALQANAPEPQKPGTAETTAEEQNSQAVQPQKAITAQNNTVSAVPAYIYSVIVALGLVVAIMAGLIVYLFRRLVLYKKQGENSGSIKTAPRPADEDKISLSSLKKAQTPEELLSFLQNYAHQHWALPKNASLHTIAANLKNHNPQVDIKVFYDLDAALYADAKIDIEVIKKHLPDMLRSARGSVGEEKSRKKFEALNPS